ncbi:MAG: Lipolytic protein family [Rickettsiales bacterium]|nr:Lipolytic protein family [Rickettsiales bacterium]
MGSMFARIVFLFIINFIAISHAQAKTSTSVLLFGDSITAGYGLAAQDSLPVQLENFFREKGHNIRVINGGVSGDTTTSGRSRFEWTLKKYNPDMVVIALGGNDVLRGFSPEITYENLDAMLAVAKEKKIPVILSSVTAPANLGIEYRESFNKIYPDLAKKYTVPLYPFLLEETFGSKALMQSDGIHPTPEGSKMIAKNLGLRLLKDLPNGPKGHAKVK